MNIDPEKQRKMDEAVASVRDVLPRTWRALYEGCLEVGFSETRAMELLRYFILSQSPRGIILPEHRDEDEDDLKNMW